MVTAGVEERFALGYTPIVDNEAQNGTDPRGIAYLKKRNMR